MNKGKPRAQGSQTAQQMAFSWLLYFSWHLSKSFSVLLCRAAVVAGTRMRLPAQVCWVVSNAGAMPSPFLLPWTSFFHKEKLRMEIPTLARRINLLLHSAHQLSKSHETNRPKRLQKLLSCWFFFTFLHACVCVCVLEVTKETEI